MIVDLAQVNRITTDIAKAAAGALPLARVVVQKVCADTKRDAQIFAPVDTGALRSSISYETGADQGSVWGEVGPTVSYAPYVEYGTSRMAPYAYMGPAFDRHAGAFVDAMSQLPGADL